MVMEGDVTSGSIIEDITSTKGRFGLLTAIEAIEVFANNTGNTLLRKNVLNREQLFMKENTTRIGSDGPNFGF